MVEKERRGLAVTDTVEKDGLLEQVTFKLKLEGEDVKRRCVG